jgi:hypothetical protein
MISSMASTPHRILACLLLLVQAMASIGAGRTLCIALEDCVHRAATCGSSTAASHHHTPDASRCCGGHACESEARPSEASSHEASNHQAPSRDPDCGCHLHLPLPERVDPISTGVVTMPLVMLPTTPCRITFACTGSPALNAARLLTADAWLRTAEVLARAVTSLQV